MVGKWGVDSLWQMLLMGDPESPAMEWWLCSYAYQSHPLMLTPPKSGSTSGKKCQIFREYSKWSWTEDKSQVEPGWGKSQLLGLKMDRDMNRLAFLGVFMLKGIAVQNYDRIVIRDTLQEPIHTRQNMENLEISLEDRSFDIIYWYYIVTITITIVISCSSPYVMLR